MPNACTPGQTTPCNTQPTSCTPPQTLVCPAQGQCLCAETGGPHPKPKLCTSYVVYESGNPANVQPVGKLEAGCDQAGLEIALAVLLAKIMSGAPLP